MLDRLSEGDSGVQVCAGNRSEGQNQGDAPVAIVFASRAMATFPPASRSPIMPEPTTAATRNALPTNSAVNLARRLNFIDVRSCRSVSLLPAGRWLREGDK